MTTANPATDRSADQGAASGEDARSAARQIVTLGLPLLLGALSSTASGIVDTAMMGRYGAPELAAVSGTAAVFDVFANLVLASVIGYQILAPRFAGRQDPPGLRRALAVSARYCGAFALALTVLCMAGGRWLTGLVAGGDARLPAIGAQYLTARAPTLLLLVPFTLLTASFNAYKKTRYAAVAGVVVNVVNLLLDVLLIHGVGPFPRWGAFGNGLATSLAWLAGVAVLLVLARRSDLRGKLGGPAAEGLGPVDFETSIPRLAWPALVSSGLDYASMAVFFAMMGGIGTAALGGGRIAFEIMVFVFGVGTAFAAAQRLLIGRSLGAGEPDAARVLWRQGQYVLLAPGLAIGLAFALLPRLTAELFTSFAPVLDAAAEAIVLIGICVPLMAWTLGNVSLIRALGHTRVEMYTNLAAAVVVQLPVGWLLADAAGLGLTGAFLGVLAYWAARAVGTEVAARRLTRHTPAAVA
ncbi:MATE family efflux transporter [Streptomyces sp. NPDC048282]|uniref:MATE family efflux transporter n=1 Tax=Streptomyces sp. NPDC048282 TaxID=3365528 RepID=UPI00371C17BD